METVSDFVIENEFFRLEMTGTCGMSLFDKRSRVLRSAAHPFRFTYGNYYSFDLAVHCRRKIRRSGNRLKIDFDKMDWKARFPAHSYRKPDPGPDMRFHFLIELKEDSILFQTGRIDGLDGEECTLAFPYGLFSWDAGEKLDAVIPWGYGQLVDFPRKDEYFQYKWGYFGIPVYGTFRNAGGTGVRVLTPWDHQNTLSVGTIEFGKASIDTEWIFNRRFANYPRKMLWKSFPSRSGFVTLAKWYRGEKIREGAFVSLAEKIRKNPEVEKLAGAVIWKHSVYSQKKMPDGVKKDFSLYALSPEVELVEGKPDRWNAYELFDLAHSMGFDRLCVYNAGWNRYGFDSGYPTRFPVNPERGTENDFRAAAAYARSLSPGYIYSVHDNYCDVYENADESLAESLRICRNGVPLEGGIWRGGRAKLQCTAESLKYAKRDIPKIARMVGRGSIYIDVLGSSALRECYSEQHPASRRDDLKNRRKFMKYVKDRMGSLASEAIPCDDIADILDLGAYMSIALESAFPANVRKAVAIPLWQLVYHDSVFCFTNAYDRDSALNYHALCTLFGLLPGNLDKPSLKLSREMRSAYLAEMTDFRFLSGPSAPYCYAAESRFSDGTVVTANLTDSPLRINGKEVAPHSSVIERK